MTLNSTTNRISYSGNGVTTVFSFPYRFLAEADLVVIERNDTTGVETTKTLTTHYTVAGEGNAAGGSVTMLTAPASGVSLIIYRDPTMTQLVDLVENDPLPVETAVEQPLDRLTMIAQRNRDLIGRALRLPEGDTGFVAADMYLPAEVDRAGLYLAFDADGKPIASAGTGTSPAASSFMATVLDDLSATAVLTTLGVSSYIQTLLDDANAAAAKVTLGIVDFLFSTDYADVATALAALTSNKGLVFVPASENDTTAVGESSNGGIVLDMRYGTAVAGSAVASPFRLIAHGENPNLLQVVNPALKAEYTMLVADTLLTGSTNEHMQAIGAYVGNEKATGIGVALFTYAESRATGGQVMGANFGVGNTATKDASITGLELDIANNIAGGGSDSKIGLVINTFNNKIDAAISMNGLNGGGYTNGIQLLSGFSAGGGALFACNPQTNGPNWGIDFSGVTNFVNGAIYIPGSGIYWKGSGGTALAMITGNVSNDVLTIGNSTGITRLQSSLGAPAASQGQWWVEASGVSPNRRASLYCYDGGATRTIAQSALY